MHTYNRLKKPNHVQVIEKSIKHILSHNIHHDFSSHLRLQQPLRVINAK
jgi:hypothetical protein